jgi:hypothetical protein
VRSILQGPILVRFQGQRAKKDPENEPQWSPDTATDRQIDQLVYQLYGLTDEEIRIVEEATG